MSSERNDSPGESNPFRPNVPESIRDISTELYHYLQEQAANLRAAHSIGQAGDSTVPWEHITYLDDEEKFTLGSLGRFVHPTYGIIICRYVQFSQMAAVFPGSPVGMDRGISEFKWLVTNKFELSHPSLLQGVCGAYTIPKQGQFGWIIVHGVNPQDMGFSGSPKQFMKIGWASTGEVTEIGDSLPLGTIYGREFMPNGLAWVIPGGSVLVDVLSFQEAAVNGIDNSGLEERLFKLEQAFKGIGYTIDVKINEADITQSQKNDIFERSIEILTRRVSTIDVGGIKGEISDAINLTQNYLNLSQVAKDNAEALARTAGIAAQASNQFSRTASIKADEAGIYADSATASANEAQISQTESGISAQASAISAGNAAVSETNAGTSATAAQNSATNAATSAGIATTQAGNASTSAGQAATSASQASTSATNAAGSASNAASSSTTATNAATTATTQAGIATTQAGNATTQASNASTYASNASTSASQASTSASNAGTSATNASNSASAANTSAVNAASSATGAAGSATTATNQANAASTSASNAATSATNAGNSATSANTSSTNASTSATNAANSATTASTQAGVATTQASNASTSASQASTSASNAAGSASNASTSATSASNSASTATTQAGVATTQASAANTSATDAATSASNAAGSASTATTQASNASVSANNAATSATSASTSATNASTSAAAASSSATVAASAGRGGLVKNPTFGDWPTGQTVPTNWNQVYTPLGTYTKVANEVTGNGVQVVAAAGANAYMMQTLPKILVNQWVEFRIDFKLSAGTTAGAQLYLEESGVTVPVLLNYSDLKDIDGNLIGAGTIGRTYRVRYRWKATVTINNPVLGLVAHLGSPSNAVTNTIIWYYADVVLLDSINDASLNASVTTNSTAIVDLQNRVATADFDVTTIAGSATAALRLNSTSGGITSSSVALEAEEIQIYNNAAGIRALAMKIAAGSVLVTGDLDVGRGVRIGARRIPVALQSFQLQAGDGDAVDFGTDLVNLPILIFDTTHLAAKTAAQTYDVRANSLTSSGFTMYAKITTASSPTTLSFGPATDMGSGVTPRYQVNKTNALDASDGYYTFSVTLNIVFSGYDGTPLSSRGYAEFDCYVRPSGGSWTYIGTVARDVGHTGDGTFAKSVSQAMYYSNAIGIDGSNNEFGIVIVAGAYSAFSVSYSATSTSGTSSATPSGEKVIVTVIPQNV